MCVVDIKQVNIVQKFKLKLWNMCVVDFKQVNMFNKLVGNHFFKLYRFLKLKVISSIYGLCEDYHNIFS